ncbi:MAG: DUF7662 domain-containing protein [Promethearchaeota archaeon]
MGKYSALGDRLDALKTQKEVRLAFHEIEKILGFSFPPSAYNYRSWWANDESHSQASDGWMVANWITENVDMENQIIVFKKFTWHFFQQWAKEIMEKYFSDKFKQNISFAEKSIDKVPKKFDYVSQDGQIVGDAKFYAMVKDRNIAPAKMSGIAEYVWFLEKLPLKKEKFLVFGNDIHVPKEWLRKYAGLLNNINFYFVNLVGKIVKL